MKKALLDENLPRQLKGAFSSALEVFTVPDLGWQSKTNGELLSAMSDEDIAYLITADRNLRFQQNLSKYQIVVVVLITIDTRRKFLVNFIEQIEIAIQAADPSEKIIEITCR